MTEQGNRFVCVFFTGNMRRISDRYNDANISNRRRRRGRDPDVWALWNAGCRADSEINTAFCYLSLSSNLKEKDCVSSRDPRQAEAQIHHRRESEAFSCVNHVSYGRRVHSQATEYVQASDTGFHFSPVMERLPAAAALRVDYSLT